MSEVFHRLKTEFPGVKLLALGQTVYWDEPMKAILRRHLNEQYPECRMIIGIHDADYFSKVPSTLNLQGWGILPHNDGSTRDLWAATGEISAFFGSETIPTREVLTSHGVRLDKIAKDFPAGRDGLIDMATEAWGWRGLVHTDSGTEMQKVARASVTASRNAFAHSNRLAASKKVPVQRCAELVQPRGNIVRPQPARARVMQFYMRGEVKQLRRRRKDAHPPRAQWRIHRVLPEPFHRQAPRVIARINQMPMQFDAARQSRMQPQRLRPNRRRVICRHLALRRKPGGVE